MERARRENAPPQLAVPEEEYDDDWEEAAQAARIAALKEEKRKLYDSANEAALREILNQPSAKPAPEKPAPKKPSLLEWAQNLEANGAIAARVNAQVDKGHAAMAATDRLADLVAKDNEVLVKDFLIEEKKQRMHTEQTGERPELCERVMHSLEKAALHRDPQREDVQQQVRAAFAIFDKDGDGKITMEEFRKVMMQPKGASLCAYWACMEQTDELFQAADNDGNGHVDYEEFVVAFTKKSLRPPGWVNPSTNA